MMTIGEFSRKYREGEVSSEELTMRYLERIADLNERYRAVLEINPDALFIARERDLEARLGKFRGVLHGVPVIVKGNIDTADMMETTGGALALKGNRPRTDAFLVRKLREAGAVVLGKANLTELANFVSLEMPNGFSYLGGQTRNARGDFDPGGSSTGSAVAVALDMCIAAVGTETSGSIISPSSSNGVVGHKPSVGLVSRSGIIPISRTQDTAGPIAKTVEDAFFLFKAMVGYDPEDPATGVSKWYAPRFERMESYHGMKFGVLENLLSDIDDEMSGMFEKALKKVEGLGGKISTLKLEGAERLNNVEVLFYEFSTSLAHYLKDKDIPIKTLDDLIEFNNSHPEAVPYGQSVLLRSSTRSVNDPEYVKFLSMDRKFASEGLGKIFERVDILLFPNNRGIHVPAKALVPSITVPADFSEKIGPFGLTFTGRFSDDEKVYSVADLFERKHGFKYA